MSPTTDDLREALTQSAQPAPPGAERLAGVRRVVARRRRARLTGSAVLTVAVAAGAFGVAQPGERQAAPPAAPALTGLPTYAGGGRIIGQATLTAKVGDERTFDITPTSYELMTTSTCSVSTTGVVDVVTEVNGKPLTWGGCGGSGSGPFEEGERLWKRYGITPGRPATVTVKIGSSDPPAGARNANSSDVTVRVGFYQAVPADEYPLPPRPAQVSPPAAGSLTQSSSTPRRGVVTIEAGPAAVETVSRTITYHADLVAEATTWAPGLIRLRVNGVTVTGAASWTYTATSAGLDLTPATLRDADITVPRDGEPFTLTVQTERFGDPAWRVQVGRP